LFYSLLYLQLLEQCLKHKNCFLKEGRKKGRKGERREGGKEGEHGRSLAQGVNNPHREKRSLREKRI
jgi:hypothetical protein